VVPAFIKGNQILAGSLLHFDPPAIIARRRSVIAFVRVLAEFLDT
jgi:hypothetical protein